MFGPNGETPPRDNPKEFNRQVRFASQVKINPFVFGDEKKDPDPNVLDFQPEPSDRMDAQLEQ